MRISVVIFLIFGINSIYSQSRNLIFDAIRKSDLTALSDMFDKKIEYCFNDQIEFMDKVTALKAIRAFLERNVPKSVTPMHQGSSKSEESKFAIANMESNNGRKFRIYIYAENIGGILLVQELRIDAQK
jgi:hypothetical protein